MAAPTLLGLVAVEGARAMDPHTSVCAVVLGDADLGLSVHACSTTGALETAFEQLLLAGPVLTTARSGVVTTVNELANAGGRWPAWASDAQRLGYVGMRPWPVQVANSPIGALVVLTTDVWSRPPGAAGGDRSSGAGQALADVCALVLQLPRPSQRWAQAVLNLQAATERDVAVHQAVGMIAAAHDVDILAAVVALAARAEALGEDAVALARRVVAREVWPQDVPLA